MFKQNKLNLLVVILMLLTLALSACGGDESETKSEAVREKSDVVVEKEMMAQEALGAASSGGEGSGEGDSGAPQAGVLTAAVWDDFVDEHWSDYIKFLDRYAQESWNVRDLNTRHVLVIKLLSNEVPAKGQRFSVQQGDNIYQLTTLADGTARLFPFAEHKLSDGEFTITPEGGAPVSYTFDAASLNASQHSLITVDQVIEGQAAAPTLDLAFMIDATGSMGDEMEFIKTELRDIIKRVNPSDDLTVRIAVVYYRDRGDDFVTRIYDFDDNIDRVLGFLNQTQANGGGDFPEEMNAAFDETMKLNWSQDYAARLLFVVADAPPHEYNDAQYTYHNAIKDATRKGIAIFPLSGSGIDKATEYLMRAMAVMTGGKYIFLTDDSGVGGSHLEPDIQNYTVEALNELMIREIRDFALGYFPKLGQ